MVLIALAIAGCGLVGAAPAPEEAGMDSSSLAALLPTAVADRVFEVSGVTPDALRVNVDPEHLALVDAIAKRHDRTLSDVQIAAAVGQDGEPTVVVFAVRILGVPGDETVETFLSNPYPSPEPTPVPRPKTVAGHPVIVTEPSPGDRYTILVRDEIVFSISAPDEASLDAMVRALWAATDPAATPSPDPS